MDDKPNFTHINKLMVSIDSYKNQLSRCDNVEEMEKLCSHIIALETEILQERGKELRSLTVKKEAVLEQMMKLETTLDEINKELNHRLARYKEAALSRVSHIETEMENVKKGL